MNCTLFGKIKEKLAADEREIADCEAAYCKLAERIAARKAATARTAEILAMLEGADHGAAQRASTQTDNHGCPAVSQGDDLRVSLRKFHPVKEAVLRKLSEPGAHPLAEIAKAVYGNDDHEDICRISSALCRLRKADTRIQKVGQGLYSLAK
jgi:hypothetical protein